MADNPGSRREIGSMDIVVDNPPHATFLGQDAQLDAAIAYLQEEIKKDPRPVPKAPAYPNKSFTYPKP